MNGANASTPETLSLLFEYVMAIVAITCTKPQPGPFPAGRRCADPNCITILNRWHEGDRCYQHAEPERATLREQRISFEELMAA